MANELKVGSSNVITYTVTNAVTGAVNDATVKVTILDKDGAELPDEIWPFTLPYVAASSGEYSYTFEPFDSLIAGQQYMIIIDVVGIDGLVDQCKFKTMALTKNCTGGC